MRVYKTEVYRGTRVSSYRVRWKTGQQDWRRSFRNAGQADVFRAELLAAARKGEAFNMATGEPLSWQRDEPSMNRTSAGSGLTTDQAGITEVSSIAPEAKAAEFHVHLLTQAPPRAPTESRWLSRSVFRGVQGRPLATITTDERGTGREAALTREEYRSPLARRPYDLRHACLSTWLNGGVATQVAEWAGHSVEMLLRVYAKCLDGQDEIAKRRIASALGDIRE